MKLSEFKGEQAIEVLADLIDPVAAIMSDEEVKTMARAKIPKIKIVKVLLKNHKKEVIEILAILDGADPEGYAEKVSLVTLPVKLLEIMNDPDLESLFTLQGQNKEETTSSSATESIVESEQ